jgi:RNA polymerase sigma-70 factor (ECF subfamily)
MSDADPFEAFVAAYQDMVYATALRLLGRPEEAEDVAQTVFLRAFERFEAVGGSPTVGGWLKTVTTNLCLNHLSRYRQRWRLFSELGGGADETAEPFEARLAAPEADRGPLETAERQEALERALHQLPDHQRVPLVLFHFEEQPYQAIADLLGVSLGKVKTDIHRGREALGTYLAEEFDGAN